MYVYMCDMMCMCMCNMNSHSCVCMCASMCVSTTHMWRSEDLGIGHYLLPCLRGCRFVILCCKHQASWHISLQRVSCLSFLCCWDTGITNVFSDIQLYLGAGNASPVLRLAKQAFYPLSNLPSQWTDSLRYLPFFF